ncbi:MAG TPA: Holliday junction resolvase RuvX [Actinomycetota bacterium]
MTRALGVDLGSRRIGLAICDERRSVATPYAVLPRTNDEEDVAALLDYARGEGATTIVLGHPLSMDGSVGHAALVVQLFAEKLEAAGAKVELWDERLTTVQAERTLRSAGFDPKRQREIIDKLAAANILQAWLDANPLPPPKKTRAARTPKKKAAPKKAAAKRKTSARTPKKTGAARARTAATTAAARRTTATRAGGARSRAKPKK